ncbi:MAG: sulfite exporter TauE/SafE family protein [Bacteroidales bacterium]|nr:sulfite exporter TauE/SafE family protein [Bacteroidales bacterium]
MSIILMTDMNIWEIVILIVAGVFVGFINTLAGGGSVISLSLLMFFGLPANVANGTNRIAIFIQNIAAVGSFRQQKVLDHKKGFRLALPALAGSVVGAWIAVDLNKDIIEKAIAIMMLVMIVTLFYKPQRWLKGKAELQQKPVSFWQMILFFCIGVYGGFLHMGVGYALLAGIVLGAGYDLVKANAIKVLIILIWSPAILVVFFLHNQLHLYYGLVLSIGNVAGALIASRLAVQRGANFVRWVIVVIILLTAAQIFGIVDIHSIFKTVRD